MDNQTTEQSREVVDQLNVIGFQAHSASALADEVQDFFVQYRGKKHVNIAERYFWQPQYDGGEYSTMVFYTLIELPPEEPAKADGDGDNKKKPGDEEA